MSLVAIDSTPTTDIMPPQVTMDSQAQCVEDFKAVLYKMQEVRRVLVAALLAGASVDPSLLEALKSTLNELTDYRTTGEMRHIATPTATFLINIRDEIRGLNKDLDFLSRITDAGNFSSVDEVMETLDVSSLLAKYHPLSAEAFYEELENTTRFLMDFVNTSASRKPLFVTDWDGTMKDYCSQYATNLQFLVDCVIVYLLQPVYSAVVMGRFASLFTRVSAVLTAGPLRGPGILDLTSLPINGPVLFSGSWGREWWLKGRRVVHEDGISEEAFVAISRLSDEMTDLINQGDFAQFALVGSGVQRKVDRLTLGVQTVFGHVPADLTARYIEAVKERIHRVDPNSQVLKLEEHNPLEIEICAQSYSHDNSPPKVWDKADGVAALISSLGDDISTGSVLVAGDTTSDIPMLQHVIDLNPLGAMTLFVGADEKLKAAVRAALPDLSRVCFVSSPDVAHAAFARVIASKRDVD